jgi:TonB family protein
MAMAKSVVTFSLGIAAMRVALAVMIPALTLLSQESGKNRPESPTVVKFVAPAYPRSAKDARIMGKTQTRLVIGRDGFVKETKIIIAHRVFESYALEALKQWRFEPTDHDYELEVTCVFELTYPANCGAPDYRPVTPETHLSAELPTTVHITTDLQCSVDY